MCIGVAESRGNVADHLAVARQGNLVMTEVGVGDFKNVNQTIRNDRRHLFVSSQLAVTLSDRRSQRLVAAGTRSKVL
jgi:hypothetical protein